MVYNRGQHTRGMSGGVATFMISVDSNIETEVFGPYPGCFQTQACLSNCLDASYRRDEDNARIYILTN